MIGRKRKSCISDQTGYSPSGVGQKKRMDRSGVWRRPKCEAECQIWSDFGRARGSKDVDDGGFSGDGK
jgi:hypothetical protein